MHSLDKEIQVGADAERLMENPAFKAAAESLRKAIVDRWAASPVADIEGQHELRLLLKLHDDYMGNLRVAVGNGKIACENLKIERKLEIQEK